MGRLRNIRNFFFATPNLTDTLTSVAQGNGCEVAMSWADLEQWIDLKATNTQRQYRSTLREFCTFHEITRDDVGFARLCATTPIDATRFLNWCKSRPAQAGRAKLCADTVSQSTIKHKAIVLYSIFEELSSEGAVTDNPFEKSKREYRKVRGNDRRPHQLIPFEKVTALFALEYVGPENRTVKAILAVLFGGALRRSEAVALRILDVKRSQKGIVYLNLRNTKRQRSEVQALPEWSGDIVIEHVKMRREEGAKDSEPLFTEYLNGRPSGKQMHERTLYRRFGKALVRVGLTGEFSPHCARATAITALLEAGLNHRTVAKFSRHSSVEMVSHYDKMREIEGEEVATQLQYTKKAIGNE